MKLEDIPVKIVCPLGVPQCRQIKGEVIEQCAWLVNVAGRHPQSEEIVDEWRCSMAWTPILLVENAKTNRGQTAALEDFRNAVVRQNDNIAHAITGAGRNMSLSHDPGE